MTQLRNGLAGMYDGQSENGGEPSELSDGENEAGAWDDVGLADASAEAFADAGPAEWHGTIDIVELCETLQGLPPAEAEQKVRSALRDSCGQATDADTLGVLLKVFRLARDAAIEGYDSWDVPVAYCERLTKLCDLNFVGATGAESVGANDFPASVVAQVYAECGRTLALADRLPAARDRLQIALNVFNIVPGVTNQVVRQQHAAAGASLARVLRRLGSDEAAQGLYLKVLQIYAEIPTSADLAGFISEYCEVLGDAGGDALSSTMPSVLAELAEEKLECGSEAHLKVLRDIADLCINAGKPGLAGPVLATRARILRAKCSETTSISSIGRRRPDALALAETEAAAEEAAQALEAAMAVNLEEGNLEVAAGMWAEALHFRESLEPPGSELVTAMRQSLGALQGALLARSGASEAPRRAAELQQLGETKQCEDSEHIDEEAATDSAPSRPEASAKRQPLSSTSAPSVGLRPAWASAPRRPAVDDGWDD